MTAPPAQQFSITGNAGDTAIVNKAKTAYSYDPGSFTASNNPFQKTYLAKLDWTINNAHRASLTYRKSDGQDTIFNNFSSSTATSYSSNWYDQPRVTESYTGKLFSTWTPDLHTEFSFATPDYDGSPKSRSETIFPEIAIQNVPGTRLSNGASITGTLNLGIDRFRQLNGIRTKTKDATFTADYSVGNHTLVGGADFQRVSIYNAFLPTFLGSYTFSSVANWEAGTASAFTQAIYAPGTSSTDAVSVFAMNTYGFYAEDVWKPFTGLSVVGGMRVDWLAFSTPPIPVPTTPNYSETAFRAAFGMPSNTDASNNYTYAPRIGFIYEFNTERKMQLRGGVGLFQGRSPAVYLSNAYSNRGVSATVTQTGSIPFNPTGTVSGSFPSSAIAQVNTTDPDFKNPVSWKGNIGIDYTLPWFGLIATAEFGFLEVDRALFTTDLNVKPVGTTPDARISNAGTPSASSSGSRGTSNSNAYSSAANYLYSGFADVFKLGNSKKGGGFDYTLSLRLPPKNGWAGSFAWTNSDYKETSPSTSSTAISNYNLRAVFNPDEDVASISNTNIKNRIVASITKRFELVKGAPTTLTLIYEGRTGHAYSWVYFGDANGDGFTFNDLLYVPTGASDSKVRWTDTTQRDNFLNFVATSRLSRYAGRVAPRNSETSPWNQTFDIKFTQAVRLYKNASAEIYVNLLNLANLLNKKSGLLPEVPFSYKRAVVGTTYDAAANGGQGQYVYTFTTSTLNTVPITARDTPESRWQIQAGARIRF